MFFSLEQFDLDHEECETKGRQLQIGIADESEKYIQMINNYKNIYTDLIEKHRQTYKQLFVEKRSIFRSKIHFLL